jgi:hypothetical protein
VVSRDSVERANGLELGSSKTPSDSIDRLGYLAAARKDRPIASRTYRPVRALLARLIFTLDAVLRHALGIYEYSTRKECLLRISRGLAKEDVVLSDGTFVPMGDAVIDLHLWNERLPAIGASGPDLAWAIALGQGLDTSLRMLAAYLSAHPEYDGVRAVRAELALSSRARSPQTLRIVHRLGFEEAGSTQRPTGLGSLHRLGRNILILLLTWAQNPNALSRRTLRRDPITIYLSRTRLIAGFAARPVHSGWGMDR